MDTTASIVICVAAVAALLVAERRESQDACWTGRRKLEVRSMLKRLLSLVLCAGMVAMGAMVTGCQPDTPKERMQENLEDAREDIEDAAEDVGEAVEDAGEAVRDAVQQ